MIQELWSIIEEMGGIPDEWGDPLFQHHQGYYESVPLSTDNFSKYGFRDKGDRIVCCVDGGNNCIYRSPVDSLHLIRVYFNLFKGRKRYKNVKPLNTFLMVEDNDRHVKCNLYPMESDISIPKRDFLLSKDELGGSEKAGRIIRTYLEWSAMKYAVEEYLHDGDILVKDGVLQTSVENEKKYADALYHAVEEMNVNLVGIAKSCSLRTTLGHPLISAVRFFARDFDSELWMYHPLAINHNPDHRGDMSIVKYHPRSEYVFRTEFYDGFKQEKEEVLGYLANQARDPLFLGYPYGLVDADIKARVSDEETKHLRRAGADRMKKTVSHRMRALDAHDKLSEL
ncbi:MAG: DNA double-strand break repair nuclease NurA [Thermoplasmata archaeon]